MIWAVVWRGLVALIPVLFILVIASDYCWSSFKTGFWSIASFLLFFCLLMGNMDVQDMPLPEDMKMEIVNRAKRKLEKKNLKERRANDRREEFREKVFSRYGETSKDSVLLDEVMTNLCEHEKRERERYERRKKNIGI